METERILKNHEILLVPFTLKIKKKKKNVCGPVSFSFSKSNANCNLIETIFSGITRSPVLSWKSSILFKWVKEFLK